MSRLFEMIMNEHQKRQGPKNEGAQFHGSYQGCSKIKLDENYFRRLDKFEGDMQKYRSWLFDFMVVIVQIDQGFYDLTMEVIPDQI